MNCLDPKRFISDRSYAIGKSLFVGAIVLILLAIFLGAKITTEVLSWENVSDENYPSNTISVTGVGEAVAVPDVAKFSFSVNEKGDSVDIAQNEAAKKMNMAIDLLKKGGVDEKDIETTGYNAYPQYEYSYCADYRDCTNQQKLIGYEVSQTLTVTVRDTKKAGELLSSIGTTGVTNISGISFTVDDVEKYKTEARIKAIESAKAQAESIAKGLGVDLDDVVGFSEDAGYYPQPYYEGGYGGDMMVKSSVAPELPAGEEKITSRVYVTYEIN